MKKILTILAGTFLFSMLTNAQWSTDPMINSEISVAAGEQAIPKIATATNGTTYIAWFSNESGNYNVRLQKFDVYGVKLWTDDGLLVSDHTSMSWLTDWDMTVDQDTCAVLTFQDIRNGDNDAFAYRISPDGEFLWGEDGIELSTGPAFDAAPKVCVTNSGNAIFAWQADNVIIRQKISPGGTKMWGENGITMSGANTFSWPQLIPVSADDVIMKYFEDSGPVYAPTRHVFAQRYDPDGNDVWDNAAVISNAGGISAWTQIFPMVNDGNDGFFIAWHDDRDFNNLSSAYVQHIGSDGSVLFAANGVEASLMTGRHHFYPQLAFKPGGGDVFVFWNEMDADQINRGIYGQKLSATGERLWTDNGKVFIDLSSQDVYPFSASYAINDMTLFYEENPSASNATVKAMRIDTVGNFVWSGQLLPVSSIPTSKVHTVAGKYHDGQWITAWEDDRNGNSDIYGQNIQLDGSLGPVTIAGTVEISPDTLVYEENPQTLQIHIVNNSDDPYTIMHIDDAGMYWYVNDPPAMPYAVNPGDSLILDVTFEFITTDQITGYVYDQLEIDSETDTTIIVIAINEDLISTTNNQSGANRKISVYPNPSAGNFYFNSYQEGFYDLRITNLKGAEIRSIKNISTQKFLWNGTDNSGKKLPTGLYFYKIISNDFSQSGKLLLTN